MMGLEGNLAPLTALTPATPTPTPATPTTTTTTTSNGTPARLCTMHKNPNTAPTPGANYGTHTPAELADGLNAQSAYACKQWQAGQGVVGPSGSEGNWFYGPFNSTTNSNYERNQAFGYQHDLQATDASQQTSQTGNSYSTANISSATQGMMVLKATGDLNKALKKTQEVFDSYGFKVQKVY